MITKKIIIPIIAVAVGGATLLGTHQATVYAQTNNNHSGLAQMIAQKFGLDQNQVQLIVDQYKQQHKTNLQQKMQQWEKNRLDQLVKNGKITQAQEQAILDELAVLKNKYNPANLKNMTPAQRKQQFQAEQADITSWAKSQGINPAYLMPRLRRAWMRGVIGHWSNTPTPTP